MKSQRFDENDGLTPLEKCQFCFLLNLFSWSRMACFLYKTSKIILPRSIITIYYMVKQVVTEVYKASQGLQRVTEVYKGSQGLQQVTGDYNGLHKNLFSN